jgi:phosphoribosyl-ATP pyrophosphohydrolase/phosphoribosyl-AMP cyclohydrolase
LTATARGILADADRPYNRHVIDPDEIAFDATTGLAPCVVQDWRTGEVLTLAYMSRESLERTNESGETWFFSRSRDELWHKGATSGNVQKVRALRYDCDADAILALVEPAGPACHTGERTCFHGGEVGEAAPHEALPALERTVADRRAAAVGDTAATAPAGAPTGSYTAKLLADPPLAGEKVREEAEEVTRAVREESDERVREEAADVIYHLDVLLAARGISLTEAFEVLNARRR